MNHLIQEHHEQFGVIVNEFGDVGIDGALIEKVDDDGIAELANGCLCCVASDDLVRALVNLANRDAPPDYVLIELSGLADPVPVAQTILDPQVRMAFELDSIIAVADACHLWRTMQDAPEGAAQLTYANTVVLNKIDQASASQLTTARKLLRALNPLARVYETSHTSVSPEHILHQQAFEPSWKPADHKHQHSHGITSFTLTADRPLTRQGLNHFAERFIISRPSDVLRAKGFLSIAGLDKAILFQSVRDLFSMNVSQHLNDGRSQLVVIARNVDRDTYRAAFQAACQDRPHEGQHA